MEFEDGSDHSIEATTEFERDLEELIVSAYGRGADIEGTWNIHVPVVAAPNWSVLVEKSETDDSSTYDPEFIDD